jgi:phosphoglycerate dehydrogenase-like enzyme
MLIDEKAIALLPPRACIINAARGGLLSQGALLQALSQGRLIGAGLDVFEHEPIDPASPLLTRPDVVATPHIAGVTDVSYRGISLRVAENVRRLMAREPLQNCVNWDQITGDPRS